MNIRKALGKNRNSSLLRILIPPNPNNPHNHITKTCNTKAEVHDNVINYNIDHYSKAEKSPVGLNKPLYYKIGPHGMSSFCGRVLNGQMTLQDMEDIPLPETTELLQHTTKSNKNSTSHNHNQDINIDLNRKILCKCLVSGKRKQQYHHQEDIWDTIHLFCNTQTLFNITVS